MNEENKVFLEKLPTKEGIGVLKGQQVINWKNSIGYKVKGIYNDINFEVEIVDYKSKGQYLFIKYKDKNPFRINTGHFQKCKLGKLLGEITNEFKIEIGTTFKDDKRDLTIIDRGYRKDNKGYNRKYYKYRCNKCGFECGKHYSIKDKKYKKELWIIEGHLLKGKGCPICCHNPQIIVKGINDIPTTAPWMIPYFQNPEEAKLYTKSSGQKILPICPDCGEIKNKPISIYNLYQNHSIGCNKCGDGISYPNKLMFNILKQLNINFKSEYDPNWCKYEFNNKNKKGRYDFYFELNNKKYVIEMDGRFHKEDNEISGQTKEESKYIDDKKDKLAKKYNIKVIRIDCVESNLNYIKNNIIDKLNYLFDLSRINWNKAEKYALSNLVKKICKIKKDNLNLTSKEISEFTKLSTATIITYLKKGTKLGWCNYNPKKESFKGSSKSGRMNGKPIEIFKNNILVNIFKSATELERQSEKLFGVKLSQARISEVCLGKKSQYKGFTFKYVNEYNESNNDKESKDLLDSLPKTSQSSIGQAS